MTVPCELLGHHWIPGYSAPYQTRMYNPSRYPQTHWYCIRCRKQYELNKRTLYQPETFSEYMEKENTKPEWERKHELAAGVYLK